MSYQKLLANSQSLADLLDENMPDLPQDKPTPEGKISLKKIYIVIILVSTNYLHLVRCVLLNMDGVFVCFAF